MAAEAPPGHDDQDDWDAPPRVTPVRVTTTPEMHLDGFDGPLDLLLDLAERARIDLARISVGAFVDQVVDALIAFEKHVSLERRADWLVLAARLLAMRARLLFAGTPEAAQAAEQEVAREIARIQALALMRAASAWLEARPQLGREVFARPHAERDARTVSYMRLMEGCLAVLRGRDDRPGYPDDIYRVLIPATMRLPEAIARMRQLLATIGGSRPLEAFMPAIPTGDGQGAAMLRRAGLAGTFLAALELAREAEVTLSQKRHFQAIEVHPAGDAAA